jgi:hypothetical protein
MTFLARDSRSKILFLQSPLKTFLLSVLKLPGRRTWARERLSIIAGPLAATLFPDLATAELSDAEATAALWLYNCSLCRSLLTGPESHRVLAIGGEAVADNPLDTVSLGAEFLGLAVPESGAVQGLIELEAARHAKDISVPYDGAARRRDRALADGRFGAEAELGVSWAMRAAPGLVADCPFPLR